jgi:predicted transposase YbfD/YdcC
MDDIFVECFTNIKDPRVERTKKHFLLDILALSICGILSGAENWQEIEDFGNENKDWFSKFLSLPNGVPSHDTISRVFSAINPQEFQLSCISWLNRIRKLLPETIIPIDGKTLRGSKRIGAAKKALHIINAWSCANGVCLGQLKVDDKSNEIPAVPELLKLLYIKDAIVTLDAMGAQKDTVDMISDMGADYVIAVKGNQGTLHETVKDTFDLSDKSNTRYIEVHKAADEIDADHGRIEERTIEVIATAQLNNHIDPRWRNLNSIARITYTRTEHEKTVVENRFYISSLTASAPDKILKTIRAHWQVENCLHWSLDVTFKEDNSRIRDENAASNMSWLRKFCLGLLKNESSFKGSIRRKQRKACTSLAYLTQVVGQI